MNDSRPDTKTSLRNNILLSFFLVLTVAGIMINIIFQNVIQKILIHENISPTVIENISRHFTIFGSGVTIAGIMLILCVAYFLSKSITRPLYKLTDSMLDLGQGKWDTRLHISSDEEVAQLAEGFNFMASHIEGALNNLNSAKEYINNVIASVPSILIVISETRNFLYANKSFYRLQEQFPSLSLNQFTEQLMEDIVRNQETGETIKREIDVVPEGSDVKLFFSAVISSINDIRLSESNDEKASVLLTITDITERTKMKEMVLQSRQDWEDTFNTIPDMITIHDKDFNIIQANRAAQEILKLPILEPGKANKCYRFYHGTNTAPKGCPSCECIVSTKPSTFEVFEPHLEKFIEIRSIPRFSNKNELIGLIHIARDITERKQIEEEHNQLLKVVTRAKLEWEATFDTVNEFIILIDKDFKIKRCNSSFAHYTGLPTNRLVNKKSHEFFSLSDPDDLRRCEHLLKKEEPVERMEIKSKDNHWFYVSFRPIRDKGGNYLHTVLIATDITDLKNTQERLKQSEQDLKKQLDDLERFYEMAVGRELRMKELKKEIKKLNEELSRGNEHAFTKN